MKKILAILFITATYLNLSSQPSTKLEWAIHFDGNEDDNLNDVLIGPNGNYYVIGTFQSNVLDADPGAGVFNLNLTPGKTQDLFIVKIDTGGNFVWAKNIGGDGFRNVKFDRDYNFIISGVFSDSVDLDPGPGKFMFNDTSQINFNYLQKLDINGNFIWAKYWEGNMNLGGLATDDNNNIFICGAYNDTLVDMDPGPGQVLDTGDNNSIGCLIKLDSNGIYQWSKIFRASNNNSGLGFILIDPNSDIYVTGIFSGTIDLDPGPGVVQHIPSSLSTDFVLKLDSAGNYIWSEVWQTTGTMNIGTFNLDSNNDLIISGTFRGTVDFDPGSGTAIKSETYRKIYYLRMNSAGQLSYVNHYGNDDVFTNISYLSLDASDNIYVAGDYKDTMDFDPGPNLDTMVSEWNNSWNQFSREGFFQKFDANGNHIWAEDIRGFYNQYADFIQNHNGDIIVGGTIFYTADLDPGHQKLNFPGNKHHVFLIKLGECMDTDTIFAVTECKNYFWRGDTYSVTGKYYDTVYNQVGCDSLLILDLIIRNSRMTLKDTACDTYNWASNTLTTSGWYPDTITVGNNCDSIVNLDLTLYNSVHNVTNINNCEPFMWRGNMYDSTGVYTDTIPNANGCLDTEQLQLTINSPTTDTVNETACDFKLWLGNIYNSSGTYLDTIPNSNGCDSAITLNLFIEYLDSSITLNGSVFTAVDTGIYQWLSCDSNYKQVSGEIGKTFVPKQNGSYALQISNGICTDTSTCMSINYVGIISGHHNNSFQVYPNPSIGSITVKAGLRDGENFNNISIYDVKGRKVKEFIDPGCNQCELIIDELPEGMYFIKAVSNDSSWVKRIMKKRE